MNSVNVTAILTESKGVQWLLAAIALILIIKVFRQDIVSAKCHFQGNMNSGFSNDSKSNQNWFDNNVIEKAEEERKRLIVENARMQERKPVKDRMIRLDLKRVANYS